LGTGWLILASALLIAAAALRQGSLLLVALLLFMLYAVSQVWAKYALRRIEYTRHLSTTHAFFGDEVTLELGIANRKILPLPWVQIDEELDEQLLLPSTVVTTQSYRPGRVVLRNLMPLGWYHRIKRIYTMRCMKRGYFAFGPTVIQSGDYFRFRVNQMEVGSPEYLVVYPRILPLDKLGIASRDPFGDIRIRRHIFQDPVRVSSVREYAPGDPLKRIHWKASARTGTLQTKVFEHTTSSDLAIFLDVRSVKHPFWGEITQLLETATIAAASIANHALDKGYRVGLFINHPYPDSAQLMRLQPSSHPDQLQRMLEALAMVMPTESLPFDQMIRQEAGRLPWVSTLVAVTAVPTPELISTLQSFHRTGRPVALIIVGGETPKFNLDGVVYYHVPAEIAWEKVENVGVNPLDK
jgi:uncharacterized protein (DUF58 family)